MINELGQESSKNGENVIFLMCDESESKFSKSREKQFKQNAGCYLKYFFGVSK